MNEYYLFKKLIKITMLFLLGYFSCVSGLEAQRWIYHTIPQIPGTSINNLLMDTHGNIWCATERGIARFDGSWMSYRHPNGLPNDEARCLTLDNSRNIWIGTAGGISKINPALDLDDPANWNSYTTFNTDSGLVSNRIQSIVIDRGSQIWIGTDSLGICMAKTSPDSSEPLQDPLLNRKNWMHYSITNGLRDGRIRVMRLDSMDNIWVSNYGGLDIYDAKLQRWINSFIFCDSNGVRIDPQPIVLAMFLDVKGILWLGTENHGVYRISPGNLVSATEYYNYENTKGGLASNRIWAITQDQEGVLWFAHNSDAGVSLADADDDNKNSAHWKTIISFDGLASNRVISLCEDAEQNMWFGHQVQRGVSQLNRDWLSFLSEKGSTTNYVNHLFLDTLRFLWVATDVGVIRQRIDANLLLDNSFAELYSWKNGLSGRRVFTVFQDSRSFLWFGGDDGVDRIAIDLIDSLIQLKQHYCASEMINCIAEDDSEYIWIGKNNGLSRVHVDSVFMPERWKLIAESDSAGLVSNEIHAILVDSRGSLWFGTNKGISCFDHQQWISYRANVNLRNINIKSIAEDSSGDIWFATEDGLIKIDPNSDLRNSENWSRYTSEHGLSSNYITSIAERKRGEVWCGTAIGATKLVGKESITRSTIYNMTKGLSSNFIWTILVDHQTGDIWFGTRGGGITRYRPQKGAPQTYLDTRYNIVTENLVEFRFHGADAVTAREDLAYEYRLVKNLADSAAWKETANQFVPIVLDNSDRPERYFFQVRTIDSDGNIDQDHDQIEFFKIKPREGGNIQFSDSTASIRLLVPPGVLVANQKISITRVPKYELADTANVIVSYQIAAIPEDCSLPKPATLSITFSNRQSFRKDQLAIYRHDEVSQHIGGTVTMQSGSATITTAITQLGVYMVKNHRDTSTTVSKFNLNIQPRIFSPSGSGRGHGDRTTVSFFLSQPSSVTIKIYNSAGRLEKALTEKNTWLMPGSNAIDWDGSDEVGEICSSGLYIVTVAAENKVHHKTVMILNKF